MSTFTDHKTARYNRTADRKAHLIRDYTMHFRGEESQNSGNSHTPQDLLCTVGPVPKKTSLDYCRM